MSDNKLPISPVPTSKPDKENKLTIEQFTRALPKELKITVNQKMIDHVNGLMQDPALRENYRENLLSYTSVMKDGRYKIQQYLDAVRYVSHKLLGAPNIEAYAKTFPDRYQRLVNDGMDDKTISSYCAAYNKTQLVVKVMEQTLVPTHVLNADLFQAAISRQAYLMVHANSEKVQQDAANSLMTHLKQPEVAKVELDVNIKQDQTIQDLRDTTRALAATQRELLLGGTHNAKDIAHSSIVPKEKEIIDGEIVNGK